jgi:tRNA G18 (ribose-2'-O)-methylase SpoU
MAETRKLKVFELGRLDAEAYRDAQKVSLYVFLDNIRSGLNVGSVFRTADAFRLSGVYLGGITVQPPHREVLKTALGAEQTVDWSHHEDAVAALRELKAQGFKVAIVEQVEHSVPLQAWNPNADEKWIVVLGNEVKGVQDELLPLADLCLEVPQFGTKHSLNISVCAGIVCWEYMRSTGLSQI